MGRNENARRQHLLEQRAEDRQAAVPRPRPRRHRTAARFCATRCSSSPAITSCGTTTTRRSCRRCRRRSSASATSARRSSATSSGQPVPARLFDPFNVVQEGPDLYRRVEIPNARIPNPNPFALQMYSFYPLPNRTPDDVYNTEQLSRRRSSRPSAATARTAASTTAPAGHSIYGSGGISYAEIVTPRPFGAVAVQRRRGRPRRQEPVRPDRRRHRARPDAAARRALRRQPHQHEEPERRQGRASPTTTRSACPRTCSPDPVPRRRAERQPQRLHRRAAAAAATGARSRRATSTPSANIRPATASRPARRRRAAAWIHKAGVEYRNLLSNYADPEQALGGAAVAVRTRSAATSTSSTLTADGGVASLTRTNAQRGVNAAGRAARRAASGGSGRAPTCTPAFSQKYFAIYSQNDWRATGEADGQPRPALRESSPGRPSASTACRRGTSRRPDAVRHAGRDRVPGRRRLQPQPVGHDLRQLRPAPRRRVSAERSHGAPRRLRRHLSAEQHRLLLGPDRLRLRQLLGRREPDARTASTPAGVPVGTFLGSGADRAGDRRRSRPRRASTASARRASIGTSRTGASMQWNVFLERRLGDAFMVSIGYSASVEPRPAEPIVPDSERCRTSIRRRSTRGARTYIASQRHAEPGDAAGAQSVPADHRPAAAVCRAARRRDASPRQNTLFPYPLLIGSNAAINSSGADRRLPLAAAAGQPAASRPG